MLIKKTEPSVGILGKISGDMNSYSKTDAPSIYAVNEFINSIDNKNNYSTEEQIIGTWIDGKPIYRKVIEATVGTFNDIIKSLGIKKVIKEYAGGAESTYGGIWAVPNNYNAESGYRCYFSYSGTIDFGGYYTKNDGYCGAIIEYTKKND